MNNIFQNLIPEPTSVDLNECFEFYKQDKYLSGDNRLYSGRRAVCDTAFDGELYPLSFDPDSLYAAQ